MKFQRIGNLFLFGLSIFIVFSSIKIGIGALSYPGSGFMPFVAGILVGSLSFVEILKHCWLRNLGKLRCEIIRKEERDYKSMLRIACVLGSLFVYSLILPLLGYLVTTFVLMVFLGRILKRMKWPFVIMYSFLVVVVTYLMFDRWLSCQFPMGVIENLMFGR